MPMPAVIVNCCFHSDQFHEAKRLSQDGQEEDHDQENQRRFLCRRRRRPESLSGIDEAFAGPHAPDFFAES